MRNWRQNCGVRCKLKHVCSVEFRGNKDNLHYWIPMHESHIVLFFVSNFDNQGVRPVKVLGILMMIDEGEADWKLITIDKDDKWAPFINNINDVEEQLPGLLDAIREWYRTYKIPDGKPPNVFGLDEKFMDKDYAFEIMEECNHAWKELVSGEKMRKMADEGEEVKKLVRKLSRNSLSILASNVEEPHFPEEEDMEALTF